MEEMASLWSYQEVVDELKRKLLYTTLELQRLKAESREEMRKNKEYMKQLVQLVDNACRERDEARNQVQKMLNNFSHFQTDQISLVKPGRANSGVTESNSMSDAQNHYFSHGSSPVESFLDPVSSPELSNIVLDCNGNFPRMVVPEVVVDEGTLVIDSIAKGRTLPEKGKLLNAVLEAGPLLQTLLLAGPLPRWRNPPQIKPFHIPQVSVRGCDSVVQPHFEMSCGSSQMLSSASVLNFGSVPSSAYVGNQNSGSNIEFYGQTGKRQRLH